MREKRPGVWELRVYLGRDAAGLVRHKSTSFHGGKRQAQRELARLVADLDAGDGDVVLDWGPESTANDAVVGWQRNGWDDLSPSTVRRYRSIWKVHVKDDIDRRKIRSRSAVRFRPVAGCASAASAPWRSPAMSRSSERRTIR